MNYAAFDEEEWIVLLQTSEMALSHLVPPSFVKRLNLSFKSLSASGLNVRLCSRLKGTRGTYGDDPGEESPEEPGMGCPPRQAGCGRIHVRSEVHGWRRR
jgi:hypothetical protein